MSKVQARWWIGALALTFVTNFLVAHFYLPFSASPSVGIQTRFGSNEPRVWKLDPGSPALSADIRSGDLIKAVSGDRIDSADEYYMREQLISQKNRTVITVERNGKQLALELKITGAYFESLSDVNRIALLFWILIGGLELAVASFLAFGRPRGSSALSAALLLAVLTGLNSQSTGSAAAFRGLPFFLKAIRS